jgi:hypothetical protein
MFQQSRILQIQLTDCAACGLDLPLNCIFDTGWRWSLGKPESFANGICDDHQAGAEHLLIRYALLKPGQRIGCNCIHGDRQLKCQGLQLLEVCGGKVITRLECLVDHAQVPLRWKSLSWSIKSSVCSDRLLTRHCWQ